MKCYTSGHDSRGDFVNWIIVLRIVLIAAIAAVVYSHTQSLDGLLYFAAVAGTALLLEFLLRQLPERSLPGIVGGLIAGLTLALLIRQFAPLPDFAARGLALILGYAGVMLGSRWTGSHRDTAGSPIGQSMGQSGATDLHTKILDTSVIIDGRIADICETGFLHGALIVPQFVLRELQAIADSSDSLRRNRGRRGLDILQRLQKCARVQLRIVDQDYPKVREVDLKLIELAKELNARIVANDFNLNKVAQVRGVGVLNINELTNSLRPVVLPGETIRVFILKEGKEHNQGIAYLDDGTMVVVDNARRLISKTIDVAVTSVLQTTAGKMIFGRYDERHHAIHPRSRTEPVPREPSETPTESRTAGYN